MTVELRLRSRVSPEELEQKVGKILTDADVNVEVQGETRILKPDGKLLLHYLPGALLGMVPDFYDTLHSMKNMETTNRGLASGTQRHPGYDGGNRTYSAPVASGIIGAYDAQPPKNYCRLTAWTGEHFEQEWPGLFPLFREIGRLFAEHVPDRHEAQMEFVRRTNPEWVIRGTPFSTITVNNTYPTGVHTDKGDLDEGFSTLVVLRRGTYTGGRLCFPEYRLAVDMQDGDLLLMDAHEWHGNTALHLLDPSCWVCDAKATVEFHFASTLFSQKDLWRPFCDQHGAQYSLDDRLNLVGMRDVVPAERISVVSYYRTKMAECGTQEQENERQVAWAERRADVAAERTIEEMAAEAVG